MKNIRNFAILAHIDHGKSTLADRILELTHSVPEREMHDQYLDTMDLERERGITIKAQTVRLNYTSRDKSKYVFNLIDTPGHVDFSYEVSRSLAACEGILLVVDASQGVEAQTIANAFLAIDNDLEIIPVINKIDLASADLDKVKKEIEESIGIDASEAVPVSAKTGQGVIEVLEAIVKKIKPPSEDVDKPLRALIFDSYFDSFRGVVSSIRVVDGEIKAGSNIIMMASRKVAEIEEVGYLTPGLKKAQKLKSGEVGYLIGGIKSLADIKIGDTVTAKDNPSKDPLPGYKEIKPMVFTGLFPVEGDNFERLREALGKLHLNDPSFVFEPENSIALGFGFRVGFLGLLHMDIIKERLGREHDLDVISTAPNVVYKITTTAGKVLEIKNPTELPDKNYIEILEEPYVKLTIVSPPDFIGAIMKISQTRRAVFENMQYLSENRTELFYSMPLAEMIIDYFDDLKSVTRGYASLDYEHSGYREADLTKLQILISGKPVDALSTIVPREKAYYHGRRTVDKLKELIPRQLIEVVIQAAIGGKIIARETIKPLRKDVIAKLYGGDITRKRKLLEKQKKGKKKMKQIGSVEMPQEAFINYLKT